MVSKETKVNWHTTKKCILCHEAGIGYKGMDLGKFRHSKIGDRLNLDLNNESYLLWMHFDNPFRPNKEYVVKMYEDRGLIMSETTVSRWFNHRFDKRGSKMKTKVVTVDKFRPGNILNYAEFCTYLVSLYPRWLVFTDKNMFKGEEFYLKIGR